MASDDVMPFGTFETFWRAYGVQTPAKHQEVGIDRGQGKRGKESKLLCTEWEL